jgi:hypothetical protein
LYFIVSAEYKIEKEEGNKFDVLEGNSDATRIKNCSSFLSLSVSFMTQTDRERKTCRDENPVS